MSFYLTVEWRELRHRVLYHYGRSCMACGATKVELHVDHIKPISKYPELKMEISNLQVLCKKCNMDKSNKHQTDYRPAEIDLSSFPKKANIEILKPATEYKCKFLIVKKIQHICKGNKTFCNINLSEMRLDENKCKKYPINGVKYCINCFKKWKTFR